MVSGESRRRYAVHRAPCIVRHSYLPTQIVDRGKGEGNAEKLVGQASVGAPVDTSSSWGAQVIAGGEERGAVWVLRLQRCGRLLDGTRGSLVVRCVVAAGVAVVVDAKLTECHRGKW